MDNDVQKSDMAPVPDTPGEVTTQPKKNCRNCTENINRECNGNDILGESLAAAEIVSKRVSLYNRSPLPALVSLLHKYGNNRILFSVRPSMCADLGFMFTNTVLVATVDAKGTTDYAGF